MANGTQPSERPESGGVLCTQANVLPERTTEAQRLAADRMRASSRAAAIDRGRAAARRIELERVTAIHLARAERRQDAEQAAHLAYHASKPLSKRQRRAMRRKATSTNRAQAHHAAIAALE